MFSSSLTLVLGFILSASVAFSGGSRVGNGGNDSGGGKSSSIIMSLPDSDTKAEIPLGYNAKSNSKGDLVLSGPGNISSLSVGKIGKPIQITIQDLESRYPQLKELDQKQLMNWFSEKNWEKLSQQDSECPRIQFIQNKDYGTVVATWSSSDGVVVTFDNIDQTRNASKRIIDSLKPLNPDKRCSWK